MAGITLQLVTLAYVGGYLGGIKPLSTTYIIDTPSVSRASTAAIVATYLHAVAWSIGWFSIPYLVGSGIFATKIRPFNMSISMEFHWVFYFGCSRAMPSLLCATQKCGGFEFFGCICLISLVCVFFAMSVNHSVILTSNENTEFSRRHDWKIFKSVGRPVPTTMVCCIPSRLFQYG
jgi:glucan phosphoethanolaminetransferase (alkaline phosphatase superfamily)